MLEIIEDPGFARDVKAQRKKHRDMNKLKTVIGLIAADTPESRRDLAVKFKDRSLTGDKAGRRECHIDEREDWLLGYAVNKERTRVVFVITGSHGYLFGRRSRL